MILEIRDIRTEKEGKLWQKSIFGKSDKYFYLVRNSFVLYYKNFHQTFRIHGNNFSSFSFYLNFEFKVMTRCFQASSLTSGWWGWINDYNAMSRLYWSHHGDPLVVVDHPVPVDVRVQDHLVYLAVLHFLPEVGHDVTQLLGADCAENGFNFSLFMRWWKENNL